MLFAAPEIAEINCAATLLESLAIGFSIGHKSIVAPKLQ